jgi:hypothetical protein
MATLNTIGGETRSEPLNENFQNINTEVTAHKAEKASASTLGHIKIGTGLSIDGSGVATAGGFKIGQFTRDTSLASGTQAITGVGFEPRVVIFLGVLDAAAGQMSVGFDDVTNHHCIMDYTNVSPNYWLAQNNLSINLFQASGVAYTGKIQSMDSDGFTILWTKTGAKTGTAYIFYLAIK